MTEALPDQKLIEFGLSLLPAWPPSRVAYVAVHGFAVVQVFLSHEADLIQV